MPSSVASIVASPLTTPSRHEQGCLSICVNHFERHTVPDVRSDPCDVVRDASTTGNRTPRYVHGPTTVSVRNNVRCKQIFQRGKITVLRGHDECVEKASLL